jgi:hypothetical protein
LVKNWLKDQELGILLGIGNYADIRLVCGINIQDPPYFIMKPLIRIGSLCLIGCSVTALLPNYPAAAQSTAATILPGDTPPVDQPIEDVDIATFEEELAPHGRWVDTSEYGRVWIPNVDENFRPYATNGRWVVTSYGNTWVSDYEWGWAAFHYGRWYRDNTWGWVWVPGRVWGPAWVAWRSGGGYYGWAPLGPSISININFPSFFWTFVPQTYITSHHIHNHYIPSTQVVNVYHNTTVIKSHYRVNNHVYVYGPKKQDIERVTNSQVAVYRVDRLNQPGQSQVEGRSVRIYQPKPSTRSERATNFIPNNGGNQQIERGRSSRRDGGGSVLPNIPSNGGNQQIERSGRSSRRDGGSPVIPNIPSNGGNQQIERSGRSSRQESFNPVIPNIPSNGGNQQIERSGRSSRQESFNPVIPNIPSNGGNQQIERSGRSSRQESFNPVIPNIPSQGSGNGNHRSHGDDGERHGRRGR